jgi:hypothetical protein
LPIQYADYTLWQQQLLGSEIDPQSPLGGHIAFWTKAMEGLPEQLEPPTDRTRPAFASYSLPTRWQVIFSSRASKSLSLRYLTPTRPTLNCLVISQTSKK